MTDLQRLHDWIAAEASEASNLAADNRIAAECRPDWVGLSNGYNELARILRTLADVRRECSHVFDTVITIEDEDGVEREGRLLLKGPAEPLRRLVGLLGGGK